MLAITCHWIDKNFILHEALLSFTQIRGRHTGKRLAKEVLKVLDEFNLAEKLFCITTDNASNNGKLMKCLSKELKKRGLDWNAETNHVSCLNHVLHLGITDLLKSIKALVLKEKMRMELKDKEDEKDEEDEDEDEDDDNKEEILEASGLVAEEVGDEEGFSIIMEKLREVAKVCDGTECSIQR